MKTGICLLSSVPMRKDASHRSEMVSQLLFGDLYDITEQSGSWLKIICMEDQYEGWIDADQSYMIDETERERILKSARFFSGELITPLIRENDNTIIQLSFGSVLYNIETFSIGGHRFRCPFPVSVEKFSNPIHQIVFNARKCLHAPYLWGGKTVFGFDCSGFVQVIYRMSGISLPRDASQQRLAGNEISFADKQTGDLAFFGEEKITHVGIVTDDNQIIHCSGMVRTDKLQPEGILRIHDKAITHPLKCIQRMTQI